jgi:nitrogen-specific signal transduction histidine kinase
MEFEGELLVISSILDITELTNITQQLYQAQKMEVVGSLAGGVAHDFNNILTIIQGYSGLALMRKLGSEEAKEIRQIGEAADRAAALTGQLLAFSRRQVLQPRNIALNAIVAGIEKMLRRTIGENIDFCTSLAPDLGTIHADPVQMEQVVMNLAVNARDAMPDGGKLFFETKNLELTSAFAEGNREMPPGRYVMLAVSDLGTGIAPEHLDRIFEPFFTTKEVGRGTGLGLSTVYGIVKQSGGYIWVYSELGRGTTFKIYLPRVDQPAESLSPFEAGPEDLTGTETVLVVEDDARVRELTAKILNQYGYKPITACCAEEALCRSDEFGSEIHLLLTDVVLASTGGRELAERLKARRPRLKVVYMSGYSHLWFCESETVNYPETLLVKPFGPSAMARIIRKTLNHL